jgi:prefoldin subunit 5
MIGHELQNAQYQGNSPKSPEEPKFLQDQIRYLSTELDSINISIVKLSDIANAIFGVEPEAVIHAASSKEAQTSNTIEEKFNILLARMQSVQARLSSVTSRLQRLA